MKAVILLGFWVMTSLSGFAQPVDSLWSRMYGGTGGEICTAVKQTADGGFILVGRTNFSDTDIDAWLVKTNSSGEVEWTHTQGGTGSERANDVVERAGGGYAITGETDSYVGFQNVHFGAVSAQGELTNFNYFGGSGYDVGHDLESTTDGGFVIAGVTTSYGAGLSDFWLIKINGFGAEQWSQTFGGEAYEICHAVRQVSGGGYALAGSTDGFGAGGQDVWLVRTNASGQILWNRTYGYATEDEAYDIIQTSDGGFALLGHTQNGLNGERDFYFIKTDANGNLEWQQAYGGWGDDYGRSVQQTSDGGYILAGKTLSFGSGSEDMWLVRLNSWGWVEWSRTFGGTNYDDCESVDITSDAGFILGGITGSFGAGNNQMWLVRTGPDPTLGTDEYFPIARNFSLHPIYPNPFNNTANIRFDLPREVTGRLVVYDVLGREMKTLFDGRFTSGSHSLQLNADNFSSGTYFVRMETPTFSATQKAVLLK